MIECDVLIVGGSTGGTAAALSAAAAGVSVCLIEETAWLGGQLTVQGVCTPDEPSTIEQFGGTSRYYAFRNAIRQHYRHSYKLTAQAISDQYFNPGANWVSHISFEPKVGAAVLYQMVKNYIAPGKLQILFNTRVSACTVCENKFVKVDVIGEDNSEIEIRALQVLDATDLGDLLALSGTQNVDWLVGAESQTQTDEPDAPLIARPDWVQPFTFPFALEWCPESADSNVISPPSDYHQLRSVQNYHVIHGAMTGLFAGELPWWSYRRVLANANFEEMQDLIMVNTAANDFYGGNVIGSDAGEPTQIAQTLERARRASLGYLYWLQTECVREDDPTGARRGYPEFRLRRDVFDTHDGCSIKPYIRESRRIKALRTIYEHEIVVAQFNGRPCRGENARASFMADAVGIGHYALDIHPNGHGEPNVYVATRPFQIPLGALVPVRLANLLPACKNIGTTHLTNGAYRLHPIEWNIGESAGIIAAFCIKNSLTVKQVYFDSELTRKLQALLLADGVPLFWMIDVPLDHRAFQAVQTLALLGIPLATETDLLFYPDAPLSDDDWQQWCQAASVGAEYPAEGTRADGAIALLRYLRTTATTTK